MSDREGKGACLSECAPHSLRVRVRVSVWVSIRMRVSVRVRVRIPPNRVAWEPTTQRVGINTSGSKSYTGTALAPPGHGMRI